MQKSIEICQFVARAINHTTWNIPFIRDGDRWRKINDAHLIENQSHINGHDHYEEAIFRVREIMQIRGWETEITDKQEICHEHLYYQHYRLKCWKHS